MTRSVEGGCQCGAVRYRVEGEPLAVAVCYCRECQRQSECGTRVYHEPSYLQGMVNVKPGTLGDTSWLRPTHHAWTASKPPWVIVPDADKVFEGQP